jgi:putative two-component system response regulator
MKKTIFIVDDNATNLTAAEEVLHENYRVVSLTSAAKMFAALDKFSADLILLDIEMPKMSGYEAMKLLKSNDRYSSIPVIFLTGLLDSASEAHGIELGAVDFIQKPFSAPVLLNRIKNHLSIDELIRKRTEELFYKKEELLRIKNGIVFTMADLVEKRDNNTGGHIDRTTLYMKIMLDGMIENDVYTSEILTWDIDSVVSSARLHDVGKIVISDTILNKPGRLTDEEFTIMKTHSAEGAAIIERTITRTGDANFLLNAKTIAEYHHEKWNGTGYPHGMSGEEIPLLGRIMAVVDVYDALVSARPYKKAYSHEEAYEIIMSESGRHFDPQLTKVFGAVNEKIINARTIFKEVEAKEYM